MWLPLNTNLQTGDSDLYNLNCLNSILSEFFQSILEFYLIPISNKSKGKLNNDNLELAQQANLPDIWLLIKG